MQKRFLVFAGILGLLSVSCACQRKAPTHNVYMLSFETKQLSNHSVGNNWRFAYTCDGEIVSDGKEWTVPIGTDKIVELRVVITEQDKSPDIGEGTLMVSLSDGFATSELITVTEDKGRYTGNTAQWEITCQVTFVKQLKK